MSVYCGVTTHMKIFQFVGLLICLVYVTQAMIPLQYYHVPQPRDTTKTLQEKTKIILIPNFDDTQPPIEFEVDTKILRHSGFLHALLRHSYYSGDTMTLHGFEREIVSVVLDCLSIIEMYRHNRLIVVINVRQRLLELQTIERIREIQTVSEIFEIIYIQYACCMILGMTHDSYDGYVPLNPYDYFQQQALNTLCVSQASLAIPDVPLFFELDKNAFLKKEYEIKKNTVIPTSEAERDDETIEEDSTLNDRDTKHAFKCTYPECNKWFGQKHHLNYHINTHTGQKPFKCSHHNCDAAYANPAALGRHEKKHVYEKKAYVCTICHKDFSKKRTLKKHQKKHNKEQFSKKKEYLCKQADCEEVFDTLVNFIEHTRNHHAQKPFKCDKCDKSYTQKHNLQLHKKNCHEDD